MMTKAMCDALIEEEPWLKDYLVPKCVRLGYCDEDKSCGRMPAKQVFLEAGTAMQV